MLGRSFAMLRRLFAMVCSVGFLLCCLGFLLCCIGVLLCSVGFCDVVSVICYVASACCVGFCFVALVFCHVCQKQFSSAPVLTTEQKAIPMLPVDIDRLKKPLPAGGLASGGPQADRTPSPAVHGASASKRQALRGQELPKIREDDNSDEDEVPLDEKGNKIRWSLENTVPVEPVKLYQTPRGWLLNDKGERVDKLGRFYKPRGQPGANRSRGLRGRPNKNKRADANPGAQPSAAPGAQSSAASSDAPWESWSSVSGSWAQSPKATPPSAPVHAQPSVAPMAQSSAASADAWGSWSSVSGPAATPPAAPVYAPPPAAPPPAMPTTTTHDPSLWRLEHAQQQCQCPGCPRCYPLYGFYPCGKFYNTHRSWQYQHAVPNNGLVCCPSNTFAESCAGYWHEQELHWANKNTCKVWQVKWKS